MPNMTDRPKALAYLKAKGATLMIKTLNKKQKQWLFDNYYVDAKTLDAWMHPHWQDYFINQFIWKLDLEPKVRVFRYLYLIDKDSKDISYEIGLNFQENDLQTLLDLV